MPFLTHEAAWYLAGGGMKLLTVARNIPDCLYRVGETSRLCAFVVEVNVSVQRLHWNIMIEDCLHQVQAYIVTYSYKQTLEYSFWKYSRSTMQNVTDKSPKIISVMDSLYSFWFLSLLLLLCITKTNQNLTICVNKCPSQCLSQHYNCLSQHPSTSASLSMSVTVLWKSV